MHRRLARGVAWIVLGFLGCRSGQADSPTVARSAERAVESQDAILARHRAALAEARAAAEAKAHAFARERIASAIDTALAEMGEREDTAAITVLEEMGRFAQDASDTRSAEKALGRVLAVRTRTLPDDHPDLQKVRANYANSLRNLGDLQGARVLEEKVLETRSRTLPEDHADIQKSRQNLANTLRVLGDLGSSQALFEKVLEVYSRTLPDDHPDLQSARQNVATMLQSLGDPQGARAIFEKVLEVRSRTLPEDHRDLQVARLNLGSALYGLGDLQGARALFEAALEHLSRSLPEEDRVLLAVRQNLGAALQALGDLHGARALYEKLLEIRSRTLPEHHPDVQLARMNLATAIHALGDLASARALAQQVVEVFARTLPEDHPELLRAKQNLASMVKDSGDLEEARALEEEVLETHLRTLPEDHLDVQGSRQNLAATLHALGDLAGARWLEERVLEVYSQKLSEDHPRLQTARGNLGVTLETLGDLPAARELAEKVLEIRSRTLPDDHPDLQRARASLALILKGLGDLEGARALEENVLEVRSRTLPEDHPDLLKARSNLASTLSDLGDHLAARELSEDVFEGFRRTVPDEDPALQAAGMNLAGAMYSLGEYRAARELAEKVLEVVSRTPEEGRDALRIARETVAILIASQVAVLEEGTEESVRERELGRRRCAELMREVGEGQVRAVRSVLLSSPSREAEERCARLARSVGGIISAAWGYGVFARSPELEPVAFALSESARGASIASARLSRRAVESPEYTERRAALVEASHELASLVRKGTIGAAFEAARAKRERAERDLIQLTREASDGELESIDLEVAHLSRRLGASAASLSFRRFEDSRFGVPADAGVNGTPGLAMVSSGRLAAFVVRGKESARANEDASALLALVDLGPIGPIEEAVAEWREALGMVSGRGIGARKPSAGHASDLARAGERLRRLVLDPLLPALGERERLVLVLDDVLHLVAFDSLPLDPKGTALVGDRWTIQTRSTLGEMSRAASSAAAPSLLAIGGVDYEGGETMEIARAEVAGILRGGAWHEGFTPLPATLGEARGIAESFRVLFGTTADAVLLEGGAASRTRVMELAPRARFLHVATHGWFASASIQSWDDPRPIDQGIGLGRRMSGKEQVEGTSPMLLCGLALAGANLSENAGGRVPGLVTAEELAALDLSTCELGVLSACDTNVGERRAGQGVASLQKALHMAGARSVITSLWKVPDEATGELMTDFYRRIWVEKKPKHQALWEAKTKLRDEKDESGKPKYTARDWAAWVLTGDPD